MQTFWLILGMLIGGFAVWLFMRAHVRNALGSRREAAEMFEALSARALRDSSESFLQLAQTQLGQHQVAGREELEQLERARRESHGSLTTHMRSVAETQERLRKETAGLVTALRAPAPRGRWGEIQLRRVCE